MCQDKEKTKTFVLKRENQASVIVLAQGYIDSNAYDPLQFIIKAKAYLVDQHLKIPAPH